MKMKKKKPKEETLEVKFGRRGGKSTLTKYGKNHFKELAKKRWAKHRKAEEK